MKVPTLAFLEQRKAAIRADLLLKVEADDWHGVADCAMDLREVEAQLKIVRPLSSDEQEARRREVAPTI